MNETNQEGQKGSEDPIVTKAPMRLCSPGAMYLRVAMASAETDRYEMDVASSGGSLLIGIRDKEVDDFLEGHRYYRVTAGDLMRAAVAHYEEEGWPEPEEPDHD